MKTATGNNPRRDQRLQSLMLDRLVIRYKKRIANEIARAMREAARLFADGNHVAADAILYRHKERMITIMSKLWVESGKEFSERLTSAVSAKKDMSEDIPPTTIADSIMRQWVAAYGTQKITEITETTRKNIADVIVKGIEDGLSEQDIAAKIRSVAPAVAASRSQTISRTETHAAANQASQATAKAIGAPFRRQWVASPGLRTRETHSEADGQTVGMDEPFMVGGYPIMYPGDQSAGVPSETINCRCAVVYVL